MNIKISDVKRLMHILLDKLDDDQTIITDKDLYWNILDEDLYNPYKEPVSFTMGSLAEDCEFLQNVLKGEREVIDLDLYKLASILKCLGKEAILLK
ncbi:hypothetical protein [Chryseobacterium sp. M5A1_1a]